MPSPSRLPKTYLIARREYLANLRTKTFWIGIGMFPVILTLSILVPYWLKDTKDVRKYAVIDRSGWLLEAIERRAASPDLAKVLRQAVERYRKGGQEFKRLPDVLRALAPVLAELEDEKIDLVAARLAAFSAAGPQAGAMPLKLPAKVADAIDRFHELVREWWRKLPPKEADALAAGLSKSRYARVDLAGPAAASPAALNKRVAADELFAYFVIGADPVAGPDGCKYVSNNLTDPSLRNWFGSLANAEVRARRIAKQGIDPDVARWLQQPLEFEEKRLTEAGTETAVALTDTLRQMAPMVFVYLLFISVMTVAMMLLTSTIEEKSNRIIEVLLSSVSPLQLMAGKIIGIAATGLTVVTSWVLFFLLFIKLLPWMIEMPDIDLASLMRDPAYLGSFLLYFLLGYLFYGALLVGIGSLFTDLKEAQNLITPVMLVLLVPLVAMIPITQDPNGTLARVLSYIPPFTPFVMMNRAAGPPSPAEYVLTTLLLLASIAAALWMAAKVFRIGILMTGTPPRLLEVLRWIGAPVGGRAAAPTTARETSSESADTDRN